MNFVKKNYKGLLFCLLIGFIVWFFGEKFLIIGGLVFGILLGLIIVFFLCKNFFEDGI